jgi:LemA protein
LEEHPAGKSGPGSDGIVEPELGRAACLRRRVGSEVEKERHMKPQTAASLLIVLVILMALICGVMVLSYNGLVKAENSVDEAKAQVETALQRKLDLIPNLVRTVSGYAKHERQTFVEVARARSRVAGSLNQMRLRRSLKTRDAAAFSAAYSALGESLHRLNAVIEAYPDLKARSQFMALQDQLEGTENRIAVSRQRYNSAVRIFNTKCAAFPSNVVAALFAFEERGYFEAHAMASRPLEVEL